MTWNDLVLASAWKLFLLAVAVASGGASVGFALAKKYGEKWLEGQFSARLERLKHEQTKEIESMRQRVQWEFSRISRIHEKEFEVLPKAWLMLHGAHGRSANLVGRLKEYPDLDSMDDAMFREFVAGTELPTFRKDELLATPSPRRNKYYNDAMAWIDLNDAENAQRNLNNYLIEHRIFMETGLAEAFRVVSVDLALVNSDYRTHKQCSVADSFSSSATRFSKVGPQIQAIEAMIQHRLHYEGA
jgi:hypothetical protein